MKFARTLALAALAALGQASVKATTTETTTAGGSITD